MLAIASFIIHEEPADSFSIALNEKPAFRNAAFTAFRNAAFTAFL
jgi:hypothetical protein